MTFEQRLAYRLEKLGDMLDYYFDGDVSGFVSDAKAIAPLVKLEVDIAEKLHTVRTAKDDGGEDARIQKSLEEIIKKG